MGNKEKMLEYRERLDKTLASHDFTDGESIKSRVRNQLLRSSSSEIQGYVENLVEKKAKELSNFLNMLRSVRNDKLMPKTNGMVHGDWKLKQDNDEYRVMYREGPQGTPFHTLLVEGYVDGPVDVCLCLSLEVSLFNKWWPQFSFPSFKIMAANCLQRVRIDEQICLVRMKVPWPLSAREAILHYYELDFFENDLIIVILDSVSDIEGIERHTHGFTKDGIPEAKDIKRVDVVGGFVLQKLTSNRSFFRTMATLDIKMDFVPPSLINFMSRQLIGSGFKFYQKTVASIAKGDEDFGKALKDPIYVRIREGLYHENRLKKAPEQEVLESEKSTEICPEEPTTETVVNNATDKDQISLVDHFVTLSPQANESCIDQKSLNEIEEEVMEQKANLEEDGKALDHSSMNQNVEQCHASQDRSSNEIEEEVIEQATNVVEDGKVVDHSSMNHNVEQWHVSRDKKVFIRPQVQHALNILNNVISLVRGGGLGIQTWSGFDSTNQQPVNLENVTMDAGSSSSRDGLDGGVCLEAPQTDTTDKAPDGAENSSNGHPFSTDAPDSPKREVKHSVSVVPTSVLEQHSLTSEEKNTLSLKTAEDASDRSQNGAVENLSEAQVLSKMSKDNEEVSVKVNGIHEMDANVNGGDQRFKQKKKHRPVEVLKSTTEYTKEAVTNEKHREFFPSVQSELKRFIFQELRDDIEAIEMKVFVSISCFKEALKRR